MIFLEIGQRAEGGDFCAVFADQPKQDIQIVTTFLHDNRTAQLIVSPVAPDKRMGHVEISDILGVLHRNNTAKIAGIQNFFQFSEETCITQNMADCDAAAQCVCFFFDFDAFPGIGGDGLFEQNILSAIQCRHHMGIVIPIHGGNDRSICNFSKSKERFVI